MSIEKKVTIYKKRLQQAEEEKALTQRQVDLLRGKICKFIKSQRERKALSHYSLAKKANTSTANVINIESGEKAFTVDTLLKVCTALGLEIKVSGAYENVVLTVNQKVL